MEQIKIIFFDIDGTLIDIQAKTISPKTVETLRRLRQRGILVCVATGRCPWDLPSFGGAEFDVFLTYNGSYCFNQDGVFFRNCIAADDVRQLIRNANALGRPVKVATGGRCTSNVQEHRLHTGADYEEAEDRTVYQLMLECPQEAYDAVLQGVSGAKIASWWQRAVDIIPKDGGKGRGIRAVLGHYGLKPEQAMAFGDGNNDIEMFQAVGTAVAMGNAAQPLKAVATHICGHVAEDGIYHYCLDQKLI